MFRYRQQKPPSAVAVDASEWVPGGSLDRQGAVGAAEETQGQQWAACLDQQGEDEEEGGERRVCCRWASSPAGRQPQQLVSDILLVE